MPYASPSVTTATTTLTSNEHPHSVSSPQTSRVGGHRRSRSVNDANLPPFSSSSSSTLEPPPQHANTAAFSPLIGIPRRTRTTAFTTAANINNKRGSVFTLSTDADDSLSGSGSGDNTQQVEEKKERNVVTPFGLGLKVDTTNLPPSETQPHSSDGSESHPAIPFPTLSTTHDLSSVPRAEAIAPMNTTTTTNAIPFPHCIAKSTIQQKHSSNNSYTPTRSPSSPIIRKSNGSIVKPSLKSSLSSGNIPALNSPVSPSANGNENNGTPRNFTRSAPSTPSIKAVHFTEKDSIVLFQKSQRPVAVSLGSANGAPSVRPGSVNGASGTGANGWLSSGGESETETERETDTLGLFGPPSSLALGYPSSGTSSSGSSAGSGAKIEIARSKSSDVAAVPGTLSPSVLQASEARVHLESVTLSTPSTSSPSSPAGSSGGVLKGTILIENVSFGKSVFVRFTLDEWQTTSEVGATYVSSLPVIQPPSPSSSHHMRVASESGDGTSSSPVPSASARQWDRFAFTINLSSVRHLHTRRLFLVVRYNPQEWVGAEFWDNNRGRNYCFVFEKEKVNPRGGVPSPSSPPGEGLGSLGLSMGGAEKKSSMPVSPAALKAKQQRLEMESSLEKAKVDRPVPKLPGPMAIGKSASAPVLRTNHHASASHSQSHSRSQSHQMAEEDRSTPSPTSQQQNRSRSHSVGSNYPTIHLKLSNYISPGTRNAPQAQPYASPPLTNSPSSSPIVARSPASAHGASVADDARSKKQNGTGAPLSPPASPIRESLPIPTLSADDDMPSSEVPIPTQRPQQQMSPPAKIRMATPPESTQASPEATLIPLPSSASSTSDSDRDNLRIRGRKGPAAHRIANGHASRGDYGNGNSSRASAPTGLGFAGRFGNGNVDKSAPTTQLRHTANRPQVPHHPKFTIGVGASGLNESSSSDTSPAHSHVSPFDSPLMYDHPSSLSRTTSPGGSSTGLNNAPPEFLQKFCFFGSADSSPTHINSPSTFLSPSRTPASTTGLLSVGSEVLPSSMVGMGGFSTLGDATYMGDHHHHHRAYAGFPYRYAAGESGTAPPLKADLYATRVV